MSSQLQINGAVPQGAILGLEAFCEMIKDMVSSLPIYKYVDDSTISEIIPPNPELSKIQGAIDEMVKWTKDNGMLHKPIENIRNDNIRKERKRKPGTCHDQQ